MGWERPDAARLVFPVTVSVPQGQSLSGGPSIIMPPGRCWGRFFVRGIDWMRLGELCSRLVRRLLSPPAPSLPSGLSSDLTSDLRSEWIATSARQSSGPRWQVAHRHARSRAGSRRRDCRNPGRRTAARNRTAADRPAGDLVADGGPSWKRARTTCFE